MINELHTVIGASGTIGTAVVNELIKRGLNVRAVARTKEFENCENLKADALKIEELRTAINGSSHVYLCLGLPYSAKVWQEQWLVIMKNIITVCSEANARLIFFDNVYMYGPAPLPIPFDESTNQNPQTKKGRVRKEVADCLLSAHKNGEVKALIGRSADIFGPETKNSVFYFSFIDRLLKGKAPQSLSNGSVKHTYSYTLDLAKALVILALDDSNYGQVWHLPVSRPIDVEEINQLFNKEFQTNHKVSYMPQFLRNTLTLFIPQLKELKEMLYQFDQEYIMSWEKFRTKYPEFEVTDYEAGIKAMTKSFK